jgi:hypothetical protein
MKEYQKKGLANDASLDVADKAFAVSLRYSASHIAASIVRKLKKRKDQEE